MPSGAEHDRFLRRMAPLLDVAWRKYRRRQSRRGLGSRLLARGVDLESYGEILEDEPEERERLLLAMRVTVSRFFRDPVVWDDLCRIVVPDLLARLDEGEALRVWCAGCACGEEPYSVAILWSRLAESLRAGRALEVLATDVDEQTLERARNGVYPRASIRGVPGPVEEAFELLDGDRVRLREPLRRAVRFARADLLADPPPRGRHLVLCRYLAFTYYLGERLHHAAGALRQSLVDGGALVIGAKERVPEVVRSGLEHWPNARCVLRKGRDSQKDPRAPELLKAPPDLHG